MIIFCVDTVTETKRERLEKPKRKKPKVLGFLTLESSSGEEGGPILFGAEASEDGRT